MTSPPLDPSVVVKVTGVTAEQRARWLAAAGREPLSSWIRWQLDRIADIGEGDLDAAHAVKVLSLMGFPPLSVLGTHLTADELAVLEGDGGHGAQGDPATASVVPRMKHSPSPSSAALEEAGDPGVGDAGAESPDAEPPASSSAPCGHGITAIQVDGRCIVCDGPSDVQLDAVGVDSAEGKGKASLETRRGSRTRKSMCPHRVPVGTFCKKCQS